MFILYGFGTATIFAVLVILAVDIYFSHKNWKLSSFIDFLYYMIKKGRIFYHIFRLGVIFSILFYLIPKLHL